MLGAVQSTETGCGGCEGDIARVLLAQAIFELNLFLYKYSNFSQSSHTSYLPAYENGTLFQNVGI